MSGWDKDEKPTLVTCLACGGQHTVEILDPKGRYRKTRCRWCLDGFMGLEQVREWRKHRAKKK